MNLRRSAASLLLLCILAPAPAFADVSDADKATARDLTIQGYDALKNKDWATAADRFARADSLYHAPTITVGLARARSGQGKLVSAYELYSRVLDEPIPAKAPPAYTAAVEDARRELAALIPRVPGVVINVKGGGTPNVTLDDAGVPAAALGTRRPADPGTHVVRATAPGFTPAEATVALVEGKVETVTLELQAIPGGLPPPATVTMAPPAAAATTAPPLLPPPDSAGSSGPLRRKLGFVGLGLGGAGLLLGAVAGGLAVGKHNDITAVCPQGHCAPGTEGMFQPTVNSYDTLGAISTAGFIAGGALALTGVLLVVTAPKAVRTGAITPVIGAGYAGAQGRF
jgi:hypothetical protein